MEYARRRTLVRRKQAHGADQALLDAREDVIKSHDQKVLDAWRLAAGRAIGGSKE